MSKGLSRYVLAGEIYTVIKEKILSHEISPGDKINIDRLARDLEISNIPIRESLSRLAAEGLVETIPFKGMFVAKLSLQELEEMFEIRRELESLALRKAAPRIPAERLHQLEHGILERGDRSHEEDEAGLRTISEMNDGVHGLVLDYCGNHLLEHMIRSYIEKIQRYLTLSRKNVNDDIVHEEREEHLAIVRFLASRDTNSAERALKTHLDNSLERTKKLFH
ncbi:GntR family transcriptional regulator [Paenibacillus chungangensis]|uniref:GntR family transcriptional regulator n=1 Tax=Paenibacillus chungangensis TaxID=696535 RepID=A0ABW3HTA8_9BACL